MSRARCVLTGLLLSVLTAPCLAHEDDPKALDRHPPYLGPGWTRDGGGTYPPFDADNVELMSWLPLSTFGASSANDCWGYVSPSGREYAIIGLSNGTGFVEVTNPGSARVVKFISGPGSLWRGVKVYGSFCYAVSEGGGGIQVISMAGIDNNQVSLVRNVTAGGTEATHTIALNEDSGYLYRCGGANNGLRIYSLADPANPQYVTSWGDRYVHEAQIVTYDDGPYAGREIAFCCTNNGGRGGNSLEIIDVTDKQNLVHLVRYQYLNAGYSHQGWLSPDKRYFYFDDELDEGPLVEKTTTLVFDVSDITAPFLASTFVNGSTAVGHNLYVRGDLIFEANYRSGIRVFATNADELMPVEVAHFDTWPGDDDPHFNGLWSNYPYFPSGTVIGGDIERGLFVWRVMPPKLLITFPDGLPERLDSNATTIRVKLTPRDGATLGSAAPLLHVVDGLDERVFPTIEVGPGLFDAVFPPLACGTNVSFYFSAETAEGEARTEPSQAPGVVHVRPVGAVPVRLFSESFDDAGGWSGQDENLTAGSWRKATIMPNGTGAPTADFDGNTFAAVTGAGFGEDVDGGPARLLSPVFDTSAYGAYTLSYARWFYNDDQDADRLTVEVSTDEGQSWQVLESATHAPAWTSRTFDLNQAITLGSTLRARFSAADDPNNSTTEAAIDLVTLDFTACAAPLRLGDLNCDGSVNGFDIDPLVSAISDPAGYHAAYPQCNAYFGDMNQDGSLNGFDIDGFVVRLGG
ncbi:MAG: hypothetical protein CHACPFDD_03922 [Phycisphaerae bacterium]|nr:hypothetical protein [Phycisphaerae bacterium]